MAHFIRYVQGQRGIASRLGSRTSGASVKKAVLVYQAGIANVFVVQCFNMANHGRDAKRLYQGDFRTAEGIAHGMGLADATIRTAACNMAGDIAEQTWSEDLEAQPFSEKFHPQLWN